MTFEEYVLARGPALVRLARLLVGDVHRAEDLVQDVLARAYPRWSRISRADQPDLYLRRMLVNARNSWWRRPSDHVATPTAASVHGRPGWLTPLDAEGRSHEPRWSPAEGMEASVLGDGLTAADTLAVAEAVRFDRRARCLTPVRVTALPPGAKLISCGLSPSVVYEPEWQPGVMLRFVDGTSGVDLFLGGDPAAPLTFPEDLVPMEGGRTAWAARAKTLVVYDLGGVRARVSVRGRYGRAEAELIADGLVRVPGAERERPATWSASLTGSP